MAGRRAQYLHPVKMYIFISLVYFLFLFQQKIQLIKVEQKNMTTDQLNKAVKAIQVNAYIPQQAKNEVLAQLYKDNGYILVNKKLVKDTSKKAKAKAIEDTENKNLVNVTTKDTTYEQYLASQQKLPRNERDGWFETYYNQKAFAINKRHLNLRELIEDSFKHNFPKMMFVLLPIFALILMINFYRSKKFYVEHLIYSFHLHSFVFLFLALIMNLEFFIPANWGSLSDLLNFVAFIIVVRYIYKSLKAVYNRSGWRIVTKMIGISVIYSIALGICMAFLLLLTLITAA